MDSMNPFAELQQYQLGSSLMGQPAVPSPAQGQPMPQLPMGGMPAAAPAPQQDAVSGWRSALNELQSNPVAAVMLLQLGTSLSGGRGFNSALSDSMEAVGRAGGIQNQYGRQKLQEEMAGRESRRQDRQMELNEARLGLEERRVDAAERAMEARLARMGGGGGGGGGASSGMSVPSIKSLLEVMEKTDPGSPAYEQASALLQFALGGERPKSKSEELAGLGSGKFGSGGKEDGGKSGGLLSAITPDKPFTRPEWLQRAIDAVMSIGDLPLTNVPPPNLNAAPPPSGMPSVPQPVKDWYKRAQENQERIYGSKGGGS